jgi:hypothetical protein
MTTFNLSNLARIKSNKIVIISTRRKKTEKIIAKNLLSDKNPQYPKALSYGILIVRTSFRLDFGNKRIIRVEEWR